MISHFSILRIAKPFLLFLRCAFWFCVLVQVLVFLLRSFASVKFGCSCFLLRDFSFQSFVSAQLTAFLKLVSFFASNYYLQSQVRASELLVMSK